MAKPSEILTKSKQKENKAADKDNAQDAKSGKRNVLIDWISKHKKPTK